MDLLQFNPLESSDLKTKIPFSQKVALNPSEE